LKQKNISQLQEVCVFALGTIPSFAMNAAVQKNKVPAIFDLVNWPILVAAILLAVLHLYWKLSRRETPINYTLIWMATIGWCFGAWLVSRFMSH
jgi:RsiW-degrading membrane proteinase PrsW (M82 family)